MSCSGSAIPRGGLILSVCLFCFLFSASSGPAVRNKRSASCIDDRKSLFIFAIGVMLKQPAKLAKSFS
ncbi:hypothetical protein B0G77_0561 [Paraburkholderia sp. BL10I2N1]|nr:hypothetical protein B0G77_0561 [Paraburkholderia sp. BL10I2N1]